MTSTSFSCPTALVWRLSGSATHLGVTFTPAGAPKHLTVEGAIPHLPSPLTANT